MRTRIVVTLLLASVVGVLASTAAADSKKGRLTGKEMKKLLVQAIAGGDEVALREALKRLARIPGRDATRVILDTANQISGKDETSYWHLLDGAASFKHGLAFSEIGDFVIQYRKKSISRDVMMAMTKSRSKYMNRVIRKVLESKAPDDLKLAAVDLAAMLPYRRTVDILMPIYGELDKNASSSKRSELKDRIVIALEALTKQALGDDYLVWKAYWQQHRKKGLKVIRDEATDKDARTGLAQPLDPIRAREFLKLEDLAGKILVIKGETARNGYDTNFDHIEYVLERIGLRPDVWGKNRLYTDDCPPLARYRAIFMNCNQLNKFCQSPGHKSGEFTGNRLHRCLGPAPHDEFDGKMKEPGLEKIKAYVERGGFLFTEDWVLVEVVQMIFPEYLRAGEDLDDDTVSIRPARGKTSHPLLRGVFVPPIKFDDYEWDDSDEELDEYGLPIEKEEVEYDPSIEDDPGDTDDAGGRTGVGDDPTPTEELEDVEIEFLKHKWKIDKESPAIHVKSKKATVLIASEDLKAACGDPAVAVVFHPKRGTVLHVLSHFGKQNSRKDEATLENLMINFLLQARVAMGGSR
ncbi:MAG: hypothetical protein AAF581_06495 [Planctomycetota bacterium]